MDRKRKHLAQTQAGVFSLWCLRSKAAGENNSKKMYESFALDNVALSQYAQASRPKPETLSTSSPKLEKPHKLIARNPCNQSPKSRTPTSTLSISCPMSTTLNFEAQTPGPEHEIPQTRNLERAGPMEAVARFKMRLDSALRLDDARRAGKEVSMSLRLSMVKFTPLPPLGIHEQNTRWQP